MTETPTNPAATLRCAAELAPHVLRRAEAVLALAEQQTQDDPDGEEELPEYPVPTPGTPRICWNRDER